MSFVRFLRHAHHGSWQVRRCFPSATLQAIEAVIKDCESRHPGEVRFVIESSLPLTMVLRGLKPQQRAIDVFVQQRVWDTANNDGVLIYVLLADRAVEIVADRGVARGAVPQAEWESVCRVIEGYFREGCFEAGAVAGVRAVADVLARYPAGPKDVGNEQPDAPMILR